MTLVVYRFVKYDLIRDPSMNTKLSSSHLIIAYLYRTCLISIQVMNTYRATNH